MPLIGEALDIGVRLDYKIESTGLDLLIILPISKGGRWKSSLFSLEIVDKIEFSCYS